MKVIKCRLKAAGGVLQGVGTVYAKVIDAGRIDAESLVDMMAANCGVSRSQVLAVLDALAGVVGDMLTLGHSVEVPGLGFLAPTVRGKVVFGDKGSPVVERAKGGVVFKAKQRLQKQFCDVVYKVVSARVRNNVSLASGEAAEIAEGLLERKGVFSVSDFANEAGCSEAYAAGVIREMTANGRLACVKFGRMSVFRPPLAVSAESSS